MVHCHWQRWQTCRRFWDKQQVNRKLYAAPVAGRNAKLGKAFVAVFVQIHEACNMKHGCAYTQQASECSFVIQANQRNEIGAGRTAKEDNHGLNAVRIVKEEGAFQVKDRAVPVAMIMVVATLPVLRSVCRHLQGRRLQLSMHCSASSLRPCMA